jgi:cysteine-rich repeat protein
LGVIRPTLNGDIRQISQTWMAADTTGGPFHGNVYLVWVDDPAGDVDNADVYYSRSSDGGVTWSEAEQLGGGTVTDQFEPFVEVGRTGALTIAWYDRRNDPANELIDVYAVVSRDGGESFGPLVRITDVSFPVPPLRLQPNGNFDPGRNPCYMGEYIGVAADDDHFYYLWGDNRNALVTPLYPAGRPDPDVYSDRLPVPGVCGDGVVDEHEGCDDRNRVGADGCSAACAPEGDASCDERVTAADVIALTSLLARSERASCGEDDANHDGNLDAADLPILVSGIFS